MKNFSIVSLFIITLLSNSASCTNLQTIVEKIQENKPSPASLARINRAIKKYRDATYNYEDFLDMPEVAEKFKSV